MDKASKVCPTCNGAGVVHFHSHPQGPCECKDCPTCKAVALCALKCAEMGK